jgi:hypothetical protein
METTMMVSANDDKPQYKPLFNKQQMTEIYNVIADKPVKTFKSQKEAADSILRAVRVAKGTPVSRPGRKPEYGDDDLIATVVKENPKKEGTKAHERFALYKKGMTVAEFIAAGGNRADLAWDVEHEFITIRRK